MAMGRPKGVAPPAAGGPGGRNRTRLLDARADLLDRPRSAEVAGNRLNHRPPAARRVAGRDGARVLEAGADRLDGSGVVEIGGDDRLACGVDAPASCRSGGGNRAGVCRRDADPAVAVVCLRAGGGEHECGAESTSNQRLSRKTMPTPPPRAPTSVVTNRTRRIAAGQAAKVRLDASRRDRSGARRLPTLSH